MHVLLLLNLYVEFHCHESSSIERISALAGYERLQFTQTNFYRLSFNLIFLSVDNKK